MEGSRSPALLEVGREGDLADRQAAAGERKQSVRSAPGHQAVVDILCTCRLAGPKLWVIPVRRPRRPVSSAARLGVQTDACKKRKESNFSETSPPGNREMRSCWRLLTPTWKSLKTQAVCQSHAAPGNQVVALIGLLVCLREADAGGGELVEVGREGGRGELLVEAGGVALPVRADVAVAPVIAEKDHCGDGSSRVRRQRGGGTVRNQASAWRGRALIRRRGG